MVVPREALLDRVWGLGQGSDEVLTQAVSKLRRQLSRTHTASMIETIPKTGYRLRLRHGLPASDGLQTAPQKGELANPKAWQRWIPVFLIVALVLILAFSITVSREIEIELIHR